MVNLTTKFAGLTLRNPVIAGSCGLTSNIDSLIKIEKNGAGAVVLKSLFEEQIIMEAESQMREALSDNMLYAEKSENLDYLDEHIKEESIGNYIALIKKAKKELVIPVIASLNCTSAYDWKAFSKQIEEAGADALEINLAMFSGDPEKNSTYYETKMLDTVKSIESHLNIPLLVKISPYLTNPAYIVKKLDGFNLAGIVLFNRTYNPDFNLATLEEQVSGIFTSPEEQYNTLRWIGLCSSFTQTTLVASSGIHDADAAIKQILAGAGAVEVVSSLYQNGIEHISTITTGMDKWMEENGYHYIEQFKGKMSAKDAKNQALYQRIQYMKYFGNTKK